MEPPLKRFRRCVHEKSKMPDKLPLVPVYVGLDREGADIREQILWRHREPGVVPGAIAKKLGMELQLTALYDRFVEEQVKVGVQQYQNWEDLGGEKLVHIKVAVPLGNEVLVDEVDWDINHPHNSPAAYASQVCGALGLNYGWFEVVTQYLEARVKEARQDISEGLTESLLPPVGAALRSEVVTNMPRLEARDPLAPQEEVAEKLRQTTREALKQRLKDQPAVPVVSEGAAIDRNPEVVLSAPTSAGSLPLVGQTLGPKTLAPTQEVSIQPSMSRVLETPASRSPAGTGLRPPQGPLDKGVSPGQLTLLPASIPVNALSKAEVSKPSDTPVQVAPPIQGLAPQTSGLNMSSELAGAHVTPSSGPEAPAAPGGRAQAVREEQKLVMNNAPPLMESHAGGAAQLGELKQPQRPLQISAGPADGPWTSPPGGPVPPSTPVSLEASPLPAPLAAPNVAAPPVSQPSVSQTTSAPDMGGLPDYGAISGPQVWEGHPPQPSSSALNMVVGEAVENFEFEGGLDMEYPFDLEGGGQLLDDVQFEEYLGDSQGAFEGLLEGEVGPEEESEGDYERQEEMGDDQNNIDLGEEDEGEVEEEEDEDREDVGEGEEDYDDEGEEGEEYDEGENGEGYEGENGEGYEGEVMEGVREVEGEEYEEGEEEDEEDEEEGGEGEDASGEGGWTEVGGGVGYVDDLYEDDEDLDEDEGDTEEM